MFISAKVWKLAGLLLVMVFAFSAANLVHAVGVTHTITVGTSPTGVAYDSSKGELFVANSGYNTLSVISDSTNAVVKTITVGTSPTGVAYDSNKGEIFATNHGSNSVSVISDTTNAVIATVSVGTTPSNLAFDSNKGEVFVVNSGDNTVSVISDSSNSVVATLTVGTNPNKVIYDSGIGEMFVCNSGYNTVSVISDSSNAVVATITVGISPAGASYDSNKREVFVANYGSGANTVSVISDSNNAVVATIPVGTTPYGIAYDSGTNEIYVSNHGSGTVSVISDSTNAVVTTVTVGTTPSGVAYDDKKGEIFVTNLGANTVSVISDSSTSASSSPDTSSSPTPVTNPTSSPTQSPQPSSSSDLLQQVWVPSPTNAIAAVGVSAVVLGIVSLLFAVISNPLGSVGGAIGEKTRDLIPDKIREWLEEVVASRRKIDAKDKTGSVFKPTKTEALAYIILIVFLAISFAYVKVITLSQIWLLLPVFLATSVIVGFVQKFFSIAYLRSKGVWSEHSIWPLGLVLFLFTTFAFKVPFSSPTRSVNSKKYTEHLGAMVAASGILISLAFAGIFFLLLKVGLPAIGDAGLSMCVIGSFFGTFPISPMSGKDIFSHSKRLWAGLFVATLIIFVAWILLI
jgi:YVTN family beta-propeller protein